ncbi:MAG: twin-arginine translocase TatA/TatE family subunit [Myxococcota bacterium]|jgi:sec-independent protein translocase protein TatA|nr:twin-arginine translocase TatA/TatE family subunit [Myxococcota bacterium]
MFGLGTTELLIILAMVLVVFGAKKLPELGKGLGTGLRSFRDGLKGENAPIEEEPVKAIETDADPEK